MSKRTPATRFTVIIVNYNGGTMLQDCVRSALAESVPTTQVIVVDNGSQDGSIADLQAVVPAVQIQHNHCNAGFAKAVNQGLRRAHSEFALLLNNDAQLLPGALSAFAEVFDQHAEAAIVGGRLLYEDGRIQNAVAPFPTLRAEVLPKFLLKWLNPQRYSGKLDHPQALPVDSVIGACVAVRQSALAQIGLLDEDFFFFMEETEWCLRARRLGFAVYHAPQAQAKHAQGKTANRFRSGARIEFQRSKLIYFRKTEGLWAYYFLLFWQCAKSLINALANSVIALLLPTKRQRVKAVGYWKILAWYLLLRPAAWGLPGKGG